VLRPQADDAGDERLERIGPVVADDRDFPLGDSPLENRDGRIYFKRTHRPRAVLAAYAAALLRWPSAHHACRFAPPPASLAHSIRFCRSAIATACARSEAPSLS